MSFWDEWENRSQLSLRDWAKRRKQFLQDGEIKADGLEMRVDSAITSRTIATVSGGLTFPRDRNRPLPGVGGQAPRSNGDGKATGMRRNRPLPGVGA